MKIEIETVTEQPLAAVLHRLQDGQRFPDVSLERMREGDTDPVGAAERRHEELLEIADHARHVGTRTIARVADAVAVGVHLQPICDARAVVARVTDPVTVGVPLISGSGTTKSSPLRASGVETARSSCRARRALPRPRGRSAGDHVDGVDIERKTSWRSAPRPRASTTTLSWG